MKLKPFLGRIRTLLQSQSLRWNFIGNVTGRVWLGVMNLVAVPVFVYLLGTESFGVVSLVQTLQAMLGILDLGLAGTVNREVATSRGSENRGYVADVARTFELIYWAVAVAIGLGIAGLAGWIADYWLTKQSMPPADLRMAIVLGGIAIAARWPVALYTGVLQGLERQVLQNAILIVAATTRIALTMAAVIFVSRTVYCFLVAQALANVLEVLLIGCVARRLVGAGAAGRFNPAVVRRVWRFAVSFNLVGTFGMLVSAADKLLISNLLLLSDLTYYSVCGTATGALQVIYLAAAVSLFPRMSYCWHHKDLEQMNRLYLLNMRLTAYLCLGPVMLLCFFPYEILHLWTRSEEVAGQACTILPVMAATILVNCASAPAYNVLIATGHTRLPLVVNVVSLPAMWAGCYFGIQTYGLMGAAACGLAVNTLCFLIYGVYCRKRILQIESFSLGLGFPIGLLLSAGILGLLSKAALPNDSAPLLTVFWLASAATLFYASGMLLLRGDERQMIAAPLMKVFQRLVPVKKEYP